jgi:hypothetical protein
MQRFIACIYCILSLVFSFPDILACANYTNLSLILVEYQIESFDCRLKCKIILVHNLCKHVDLKGSYKNRFFLFKVVLIKYDIVDLVACRDKRQNKLAVIRTLTKARIISV